MNESERKEDLRRSIKAILTAPSFSALGETGSPRPEVSDADFLRLALEALRKHEPRIEIESDAPTGIHLGNDGIVTGITLRYTDKDSDESDCITVRY